MSDGKIIHLVGTRLSPEVVLHRTLNKLDRIKSVSIVIQWDDDSMDVDWSQQTVSTLCMGSMVFSRTVMKVLNGNETPPLG